MNLTFSIALSLVLGEPRSIKVPDSILANIARKLSLKEQLGIPRATEDDLANIIEAIFAVAWLQNVISIREASARLAKGLSSEIPISRTRILEIFATRLSEIIVRTIKEVDMESCLRNFKQVLRRKLEF